MKCDLVRIGCRIAALLVAAAPFAAAGAPDVQLISQGREVALERHLVPGKLVVFDFYADWCAPCRVVTPHLERLAAEHPDRLALRTIDVVNWESPVVRQHGISSIPHLVLFGPDGARLAEGDAQRVLRVLSAQLGTAAEHPGGAGRFSIPPVIWAVVVAALVATVFVGLRRSRSPAAADGAAAAGIPPETVETPRIWLVLTPRGLEGPMDLGELAARARADSLGGDTKVRRQGEGSWRRLDDLIDLR